MYIPTWLLVAVAVVALLAFWRALVPLLLLAAIPVLLASMGFGWYYAEIKHEYTMALIVGAPCLLLTVWGLGIAMFSLRGERGRLNVGALNMRLGLHSARAAMHQHPTSIMKSRLAFARSIHLGRNLLQFYGDVRHMPSWYAGSLPEPWSSDVIAREAIARVKMRDLTTYGIEIEDYAADHEATVLKFTAAKKDYVFCGHDSPTPSWVGDVEDEPSYMFSAVKVYVVELPSHLVLEDQIVRRDDGYGNVYRFDHIESFRPGGWLATFMKIGDDVRAESEASLAKSRREWEVKRASKFS